jgi:hypothetical protein
MRPEVFQVKFAAGATRVEQKKAAAFGKALWEVGKEFGGNFADTSLGLDNLRDRDEIAYSKISSAK